MFRPDFGNTELEGLKEITFPSPVSYTPQTTGWYILFTLLILLLAFFIYRFYRSRKKNRYRYYALKKLDEIEKNNLPCQILTEIPILIKQTALKFFPRTDVAKLSGKEWLLFLDKSNKGKDFSQGVGQLLSDVSYQSKKYLESIPEQKVNDLVSIVRIWIKEHKSENVE